MTLSVYVRDIVNFMLVGAGIFVCLCLISLSSLELCSGVQLNQVFDPFKAF